MSKKSEKKTKEDIKKEVKGYLDFSEKHKQLAEEIAAETAARVCGAGSEKAERTNRLTFEQKVRMAANVCIRHSHTGYDDILIEKSIEQSYPFNEDVYKEFREDAMNEVSEFIKKHRE